jgi:hypothetical protein
MRSIIPLTLAQSLLLNSSQAVSLLTYLRTVIQDQKDATADVTQLTDSESLPIHVLPDKVDEVSKENNFDEAFVDTT